MKNNFYILICLTALIAVSCVSSYKYRYETKNYNAVFKFTDKDIIIEDDYDYEIIDTLKDGSINYRNFTKDSVLISNWHSNLNSEIDCEFKILFLNGKIKELGHLNKKGYFHGEVKTFYQNGNKRRQDYFNNGKLDSGTCWDIDGNVIKHFDYDIEPIADLQLIMKHLIYPENLRRKNIEERVFVGVAIDSTGKPIKFKYDNSHSKEFIDEIARVIMLPGIFKPRIKENIPINSYLYIPVNFRLK